MSLPKFKIEKIFLPTLSLSIHVCFLLYYISNQPLTFKQFSNVALKEVFVLFGGENFSKILKMIHIRTASEFDSAIFNRQMLAAIENQKRTTSRRLLKGNNHFTSVVAKSR